MNLYKRGLIFATFLGCCLSLAFIAASLSTGHWVQANVKRSANPLESDGYVSFGLFHGKRELNVGYGWRTYSISVTEAVRQEPDLMHFGLYVATLSCLIGCLLFAFIGALMAIVNTASTPVETMTGKIGLFVWNALALGFSTAAVVTWIVQFYIRLYYNILVQEDLANHWISEGQATLGYSFWFVIGAAFSHVANIVLLVIINGEDRQKTAKPLPSDKTNGAVLLY